MDKPGHEICAQKKMDVSSFMGRRNASQGLALWKSSIGTPERCPLDLCRSVSAPTVTGASINEDARSLIENASSLSQDAPAPRPDPHSLRLDPRSFRPDPRSLLADGRSRVIMLARDLGEPLIGHGQDTQSGSMGTHRRSKKRHRDSKNAHCPSNEPHCESNGSLCDLFLPLFNNSEGPAFFIPLPQFTIGWS